MILELERRIERGWKRRRERRWWEEREIWEEGRIGYELGKEERKVGS